MSRFAKMTEYDAVIVGAGPAGAATGMTLARAGRRVLALEKRVIPTFNIGETLPPSAIDLVEHYLGPVGRALNGCSRKSQGNISLWGGDTPQTHDFFFNPNGSGLCVNRNGFDQAFRDTARASGVVLMQGASVADCSQWQGARSWDISIETDLGQQEVRSSFLIDATGRNAAICKTLGIERQRDDQLFAYALRFEASTGTDCDTFTRIEACPFGWWYSNALPNPKKDGGSERVVVLHTDKDLKQAKHSASAKGFLALLSESTLLPEFLEKHAYRPVGKIQGAAAGSERARTCARDGYLAVGDAAQALDPLSSQGLYQALQSGSLAGQMVNYALANASAPGASKPAHAVFLERYAQAQNQNWQRYQKEHNHFYSTEDRWADQPFWRRRRNDVSKFQTEAAKEAL